MGAVDKFENDLFEKYPRIMESLRISLTEARFMHTLGVAFTAASLGMRYGVDVEDCLMAGLLHDCAKCQSAEENIELMESHGVEVSDVQRENTKLLHAGAGAVMAREKFGIEDEGILNAIRLHTTGDSDMTILEKIVYIADYIEPFRDTVENLSEIRKLAFTDIDGCLVKIMSQTVGYLKKLGVKTDIATMRAYEYYSSRANENN
ncbi:MAG: bis(5'-nucleosyl)-tetraphosphatase (symmetrical) YqeK [Eubacterium sp.]|nr:bis(5'-nucleosyl)-tetraphosphatase (symmetrical) YqeK [Eubacterium sp.]